MIRRHPRWRHGRIRAPGSTLLLVVALAGVAVPAASADALRWLTQAPPRAVEAQVRVTSHGPGGGRQVAELALDYRRLDASAELSVKVIGRRQTPRVFRLRSDASGGLEICERTPADPGDGAARGCTVDALVPETLLPWRVLALGWRHGLRVREAPAPPATDATAVVVELVSAATTASGTPTEVWQVRRTRGAGQPSLVTRIDETGQARGVIELLEFRDTVWGRVAVRSMYRDLESGARVLLEVRGGRVIEPPSAAAPRPDR